MNKWLFLIIIVLIVSLIAALDQVSYSNKKWETAEANVKAYSSLAAKEKSRSAAFKLTVDQLKYFNDSIFEELDNTRKELKIKDKQLKSLQYVASSFSKRDTVTLRDTLFKEPSLQLDTLFGDEWYSLNLVLKYPSMIVVKPMFKSEKHIVLSSKKETVNPPKKFFLFRWFQKKHTVLNINVIEKNPYSENEETKFVEIVE